MRYRKPQRLQPGDTVAILSPSWGGPAKFPHIYDSGIKTLKELGLQVKEYPTARADPDYLWRNPKARARDINAAFADQKVKAIIASIGGEDSVRILPYLDRKVIQNNPKILLGYSDTTTLTTYCNQLGMVTFNGPAVMSGFSQWKSMPQEYREHVRTLLFDTPATYEYRPYAKFSEGYPDWTKPKNTGQVKPWRKTDGWRWIQGDGRTEGRLFGGCIEVLEFTKGTQYWPQASFWKRKILFLETSEDKPTPDQVKWMLRNYGMQGVFDNIVGVLVGRARSYTPKENEQLYQNLQNVIGVEFDRPDLPIIANMDFGHTEPQHILPLGILAEIDCKKRKFRLLEAATK